MLVTARVGTHRERVFVLVHEYRHPGLLIEKVAVSGRVKIAGTSWRLEVGGKG